VSVDLLKDRREYLFIRVIIELLDMRDIASEDALIEEISFFNKRKLSQFVLDSNAVGGWLLVLPLLFQLFEVDWQLVFLRARNGGHCIFLLEHILVGREVPGTDPQPLGFVVFGVAGLPRVLERNLRPQERLRNCFQFDEGLHVLVLSLAQTERFGGVWDLVQATGVVEGGGVVVGVLLVLLFYQLGLR